jgi:hypothetical protein
VAQDCLVAAAVPAARPIADYEQRPGAVYDDWRMTGTLRHCKQFPVYRSGRAGSTTFRCISGGAGCLQQRINPNKLNNRLAKTGKLIAFQPLATIYFLINRYYICHNT